MSTLKKRPPQQHNTNKRPRRNAPVANQQQQVMIDDNIDDEEQRLTASLFGNNSGTRTPSSSTFLPNQYQQKVVEEKLEYTFEVDRIGDPSSTGIDIDDGDDIDQNIVLDKQTKSVDVDDDTILHNNQHESTASVGTKDTIGKAAWVDDDDNEIGISLVEHADRIRKLRTERNETNELSGSMYQERLRQRFINTTQATSNTSWAKINPNHVSKQTENDIELDDQYESISTSLLQESSSVLPPNHIRTKRCPDVNISDPNQSVTQVVQFYRPSSSSIATNHIEQPIAITAGFDKTLRFFQCTEEYCKKLHGVHFSNFPIYSASFIGSSGNVVITGRRPFFYMYDTIADKVLHIPKLYGREEKSWERCVASPYDDTTIALLGNDGYVILYDTKRQTCRTTQPIKLNGSVRTVSFANNGLELLASGSDGDIYRYDIRSSTSKCIERFSNMDGTITSNIACSRRTFAVGAESGVVNIYAEHEQQQKHTSSSSSPSLLRGFSSITSPRTPLKSIMNLKTSVDAMQYNHDGQILAISSRREKDTMKLIHIPTRTVYSNWPTSHTPLGYVWSLDFSPQSKFLAIGNDQGKCLLYKLMHYD